MESVAEDVWLIPGRPRFFFNVFLVQDALVDAGTRFARSRILPRLRGRTIRNLVLTHCHPDHQGVAKTVCDQLGAKLACHQGDVAAMEGREPMQPNNRWLRLGCWLWAGPPHRVDRVLREGEEIAGFRVVHAPGHTPGHIVLFRDADRLAIAGDLLANISFLTRREGLRQPPPVFCVDPAENRRSILKLHALRPRLVCFGHGPPLVNMNRLDEYAERIRQRTAATVRLANG